MSNLLDKLLADEAGPPSIEWRPDRDDTHPKAIGGRVAAQGVAAFGDDRYQRVVIDGFDGKRWRVVARHAKLAGLLGESDVRVGDELAIVFRGQEVSQKGRVYFDYSLAVEHGAPVDDIDDDAVNTGEEPF